MLIQAVPIFKEGGILRQSMLQALSDHAFLANQLLYKGYSNGIISGCELTTTEDIILLKEGIIFYEGQTYLITESMAVEYKPTNTTMVMKIHFSDILKDANFYYCEMEVFLTEETEIQKGELELCRFKLQDGARLRYVYQDFEDRCTEFDTLNTIYASYAAKGESTLAPGILRDFAKEMLTLEELSDFDTFFCLQILAQERNLNKEAIVTYLERRKKEKLADTSNLSVFQELARIIRVEKNGVQPGDGKPVKRKWSMQVD